MNRFNGARPMPSILHGLLHLLYPGACHVCDAPLPPEAGPFCDPRAARH
jgi:hypothetical protein